MQTQTETAAAAARPLERLTLDDLAAMTVGELGERYGRGTVPDSLRKLDGKPACRMLAVRGIPAGPAFGAVRRFAASKAFPWAGKTFRAQGDQAGEGVNRVRLAGERELYPFHTRIEPSVVDGKPCIFLDYDLAGNPFFIRAIRDELREVSPGLFLGPALIDTRKGKPILALYFACDANAGHR